MRVQTPYSSETGETSSFNILRDTEASSNNCFTIVQFSSVQSLSRVQLFATLWTAVRQASLSITNVHSPPKPMSIELVMPSKPPHPLSSPLPPALNLSQHQGLFKSVSSLHQVAKVLEFQVHQPRQYIKKQRHYFVNKDPSSQGYGFSSGNVWIWELDYKESWAWKNWCL